MSILYVNPGYGHLMHDVNIPSFEGENDKYTNCNHYIVPLDYQNWHTVYTNDRLYDWYVRFDIYTNLANKSYGEYEGFLQLGNYQHKLSVNIDSKDRLVIDCDGEELIRLPFTLSEIHSYELHVYSAPKKNEVFELWENGKLIYQKKSTAFHQYFKGTNPYWLQIKNIVYLPNQETYRFGTAISNLIVGNTRLNDATINIVDADIETDWEERENGLYSDKDGQLIQQKIKNLEAFQTVRDNEESVYAITFGCIDANTEEQNEQITYMVDDTYVEEQFVPTEKNHGTQCEIMEIDPVNGSFWDYDTIQRKFNIKSGGRYA